MERDRARHAGGGSLAAYLFAAPVTASGAPLVRGGGRGGGARKAPRLTRHPSIADRFRPPRALRRGCAGPCVSWAAERRLPPSPPFRDFLRRTGPAPHDRIDATRSWLSAQDGCTGRGAGIIGFPAMSGGFALCRIPGPFFAASLGELRARAPSTPRRSGRPCPIVGQLRPKDLFECRGHPPALEGAPCSRPTGSTTTLQGPTRAAKPQPFLNHHERPAWPSSTGSPAKSG